MSRPIPAPFFEMDQQFAHRQLVIKVKYGKTLRRISVFVHGNLMDHNMGKLRAKIIDFFKFSNDAAFILSYVDEDGDNVTLDNDDELRDAVISQRLNPLRIDVVKLKSTGGSDVKSKSSSRANSPQSDTLPIVDEPLKSVPEPFVNVLANLFNVVQKVVSSSPTFEEVKSEPLFRSAMVSLSKDVKKAASFSPALTQVMDQLSKVGSSNPRKASGPTGDSSGGASGASTQLMDLNIVDEPKASTEQSGDVASSAALATDASRNASASPYPLKVLLDSLAAKECSGKGKDVGSSKLDAKPANENPRNSDYCWSPLQIFPTNMDRTANTSSGDSSIKPSQNEACASFPSRTGFVGHSGIPFGRQVGSPDFPHALPMHPYMSSPFCSPYVPPLAPPMNPFHRGVQCDGCGMHPIEWPSMKPNGKGGVDILCHVCFNRMGNEDDYTKIERASHRAPRPINPWHPIPGSMMPPPNALLRPCGVGAPKAKLDSRFIQDVAVSDGTIMPPLTHFTKIWRLRNVGMVAWPVGSQLVWVGGNLLGDRTSVDLQISGSGFPVDKELDIAVNFTAPSRAGRHASYWRMASPSGQRFGQQVWVMIQVRSISAPGGFLQPDLNLNLPPESSGRNGSVIIDVTEMNSIPTPGWVNPEAADAPKQLVEQQPAAEVVGNSLDANDEALKYSTTAVPFASPYLNDVSATPSFTVEETLLKELDEMGFKQIDLNKEVLRLNEYDLGQSVVNLCGLSEWDPLPSELNSMVSELNAMGFPNKELNKKLLMKNGGSIKRAVLDLIAGKME